jgi:hypothetical protein
MLAGMFIGWFFIKYLPYSVKQKSKIDPTIGQV